MNKIVRDTPRTRHQTSDRSIPSSCRRFGTLSLEPGIQPVQVASSSALGRDPLGEGTPAPRPQLGQLDLPPHPRLEPGPACRTRPITLGSLAGRGSLPDCLPGAVKSVNAVNVQIRRLRHGPGVRNVYGHVNSGYGRPEPSVNGLTRPFTASTDFTALQGQSAAPGPSC
jgi:hypothetical protein